MPYSRVPSRGVDDPHAVRVQLRRVVRGLLGEHLVVAEPPRSRADELVRTSFAQPPELAVLRPAAGAQLEEELPAA
jgi:hypothetical protein